MSVLLTAAGAKVASVAFENGVKMLSDISKGDSLIGYASAGAVEPSCFVDEDVRNSDMLPDTLQLAQSVFAAYYLRAFSMHNISIGNASIASRLDKFATRRQGVGGALSSVALEEFEDRLMVEGEERNLPEDVQEIADGVMAQTNAAALESMTVKGQQPQGKNTPQSQHGSTMAQAAKKGVDDAKAGNSFSFGKSVDVNDPVNLGTGRMINVSIKDNGKEVTFPVLIRLNAMYMATQSVLHVLASGSEDISFSSRFKKWRLGGIDFWRDLVMCQDLIDAHKKNLKADTSGVYLQMMQKRRQNTFASLASQSLSANNSSNITIISQSTAEALEMKIFGKLKDFNTRQKLFQQGYGMLMFVIDKQWGRVRMYVRDIPEYTELSERDLKAANKGGGVDIGDVLNSFKAGMGARF